MKTASIKSIVAAMTGLSGAIMAVCYGYASSYSAIVGFGAFFVTLGIQYVSIKFKIIVPALAVLTYLLAKHPWH
jgi:hypothetical protein